MLQLRAPQRILVLHPSTSLTHAMYAHYLSPREEAIVKRLIKRIKAAKTNRGIQNALNEAITYPSRAVGDAVLRFHFERTNQFNAQHQA